MHRSYTKQSVTCMDRLLQVTDNPPHCGEKMAAFLWIQFFPIWWWPTSKGALQGLPWAAPKITSASPLLSSSSQMIFWSTLWAANPIIGIFKVCLISPISDPYSWRDLAWPVHLGDIHWVASRMFLAGHQTSKCYRLFAAHQMAG